MIKKATAYIRGIKRRKNDLRLYAWLAALLAMLLVSSCSSSGNTTIITSAPTPSKRADTTAQANGFSGNFQQLTIGENQKIESLDPLFITNAAEMRTEQLIYEGLVRYNRQGKIIPAVAEKWDISNNHKQFTFHIRSGLFYHDSNIFSNGRGRLVRAADVKKDFERMAKRNVPERAARFFMNIKGFEPYFQEQHKLMQKSERMLKGINGIKTPNDSTVVFSLDQPDNQFLKKLASPFAVIYPVESATKDGFQPVGAGPFTFSQQRSDSMFIFAKFNQYYKPKEPKLNRVDVITHSREAGLLHALTSGDVQLIPELWPEQFKMVHDNNGLKSSFANKFNLIQPGGMSVFFIRYNSGADISKAQVSQALGKINKSDIAAGYPNGSLTFIWSLSGISGGSPVDSLSITHTGNSFLRDFYGQLSNKLGTHGIRFAMVASRVANRTIPLYDDAFIRIQDEQTVAPPANTLLTVKIKQRALASEKIRNLQFNHFPWWIDLRNTTILSSNSK